MPPTHGENNARSQATIASMLCYACVYTQCVQNTGDEHPVVIKLQFVTLIEMMALKFSWLLELYIEPV